MSSQPNGIQTTLLRALQHRWAKRIAVLCACLLLLGWTGKVLLSWYAELREELRVTQEQIEEIDDQVDEVDESHDGVQDAVEDASAILVGRIEALEAELALLRAELDRREGWLETFHDVEVAAREAHVKHKQATLPQPNSEEVDKSGKVRFKDDP